MPKNKISEYSTTNSANTDIESINIDEGCPPSSINNAIRELMVHLKEFQTGSSGDPLTVAGGFVASGGFTSNTMTVTGILTASGGTILSSTNTLSGGNILSGTNTISGSAIISGNINSSGTTNTFSGGNILSGTNTFSGTNIFSSDVTLNAQSDLRFADSDSSNWVAFQAPATVASNVTWTLPDADGTANQALVTDGSGTLSFATSSGSNDGFKNRIINGDMRIAQRGTAAVTTTGAYPVDRFYIQNATDGAVSAQQDSSAPAGFVNSVKITATTADGTLTTTQNLQFIQAVEGVNVSDLAWGTANAKTVTLSFWVRSSLTGTFGGSLRDSAINRSYPFSYSISVADTWEYKTVTIAGDTSGTWLTTTGVGIYVNFGLGVGPDRSGTAGAWAGANYIAPTGAVSVIGTLNATWFITGVQLEVGSVATPFERRPYGTELALCQRYYYKTVADAVGAPFANGYSYTTTASAGVVQFAIPMRTRPTALEQTGTAGDYYIAYGATSAVCSSVPTYSNASKECSTVIFTISSGLTVGQGIRIGGQTAAGYLAWSAEL